MHDRGYTAVGVGDICSAAGVNKGSFYYFFESKQQLAIAAIDEHRAAVRERWEALLSTEGDPLDRVERLLDLHHRLHAEARKTNGHVVGCFLGNMALERSAHDTALRERLEEAFAEQQKMLASVLAEAKKAKQLRRGLTASAAARDLLAFVQGQILMAKLADDPDVLRKIGARALRLVTN